MLTYYNSNCGVLQLYESKMGYGYIIFRRNIAGLGRQILGSKVDEAGILQL